MAGYVTYSPIRLDMYGAYVGIEEPRVLKQFLYKRKTWFPDEEKLTLKDVMYRR